jgi:hypothetical protein|tara:strand:- start:160 stop:573 length:414 start_codon:yes stop_codon:yes gene_type:complete
MYKMKTKNTTTALLKALACLAFAFALVFSPPSASHAASGLHDDHQMDSVILDHVDNSHSHEAMSSTSLHNESNSTSKSVDDEQSSTQCCSGICLSVALTETDIVFGDQTASGVHLTLHAQTASIEPSGFLRPPQFLI